MALLPVIEYPDPDLRRTSSVVTAFDADLGTLVDDLFETLADSRAIGLSAPQVGRFVNVAVVHVPDDEYGAQAYINPEVLASAVPGIVEEGCLSVPGVVGNVIRPTQIRVAARDRDGRRFESDLTGMHAVCLQHEMDHMDGRLFIDRLSWFRRMRIKAAARRRQQRSGTGGA